MAKIGKFKCPVCGRTFAMAAHLGRHQSTAHAAKKRPARRAVVKRRRVKRAPVGPRPALPTGASEVAAQLGTYRSQLATQRAEIDSQLTAIDSALAVLGAFHGAAPKRIPRRR